MVHMHSKHHGQALPAFLPLDYYRCLPTCALPIRLGSYKPYEPEPAEHAPHVTLAAPPPETEHVAVQLERSGVASQASRAAPGTGLGRTNKGQVERSGVALGQQRVQRLSCRPQPLLHLRATNVDVDMLYC